MARKTKTLPPKTRPAPIPPPPTRAEAEALQAFYEFVAAHERAPTQREVSDWQGKSPTAAQVPLERLEAKGYLAAAVVQARGPLHITELGEKWLSMFGSVEAKPKRKRAS